MEQLLTTKFYIPPTREKLVLRSRLIEKLNEGLPCKLALISAPAGFGKTTLVSEWIQDIAKKRQSIATAWLSLDEGDNDPRSFLTYFVTSLIKTEGIEANIGDKAIGMLQSPQPPPTETILTSLINDIVDLPSRIIFVLDDYHNVESQQVDSALAFLLDRLPLQMHLVIATRVDPQLPLARLRAQCQMTELRAADLRFTTNEAAEFLNQVMGLNLLAEDIQALEARTEGWIAGLQLAAVSMQGYKDTTSFIKSFTGNHRFVLDYLIEEVLEQQPESIQDFLLQTSILDRMTGPLCDALSDRDDGQAILEMLDRANLFIIPLDNKRQWYRYHRLFADLLRQRLRQIQPEQVPILHHRASEWYQQMDLPSNAIRHAIAAKDIERAAVLAEMAWPEMHRNYKGVTWLRWVEAIPDEIVRARPVLSIGYGWSLIDSGDLKGADLHLRDAEQWLDARATVNDQSEVPPVKQVELDEERIRSLSASIANARAYLTQARGDVAATEEYAQQALNLLPEDDYFEHGLSAILLGFAYWSSGNLEAARREISDAISNMRMLGKIPFIISFTSYLADIMIAQGHLNETKKTYLKLLELAGEHGEPELPETAVAYLGLSEIYHEQGDLKAARGHLLRSERLGELLAFPPWYRHWILAQIRIKESEGDFTGVYELLDEAENLYYRHPIPDIRPLTALITRAQLAEGRLAETLLWVREQGLSVDDDLSYLREFEHLTLARVLIAQYRNEYEENLIRDVIGLLDRLLKAAEEGRRMGSVIEILVLQALTYEVLGNLSKALISLERALALAEPEGYVRTFVSEGAPMEVLLKKIKPDDTRLREYVGRLLGAFGEKESHPPRVQPLVEPLSEREIEVLQLIADGLTNPEIAARLFLSLNTVKVHTRNIYGKLDAHNRTGAVARGKILGILPTD